MTVRTNDEMMPSFTVISNDFIDRYMASANGEYVKVYLYVLRAGGHASCEEIADALEMPATDAARAVNYWKRQGLLSTCEGAEPDASRTAGAGQRSEPEAASYAEPEIAAHTDAGAREYEKQAADERPAEKPEHRCGTEQEPEDGTHGVDIEKLRDDEEFAGLLYCLQQYMGRTFGQRDVESLGYIYDSLHMSADMIEYLAEVCVKRGRTSARYMEAIARDWSSRGVTTVEEARAQTSQYSSQVWTVMRAFGLNDRKPAQVEQSYVEKWFQTYGFSEDIVKEAISRTMETIHKPSFQYADSILERWNAAGIKRLEEIGALDREHDIKSREKSGGYTGQRQNATRFSNFEQRDTDLDGAVLARLRDKI